MAILSTRSVGNCCQGGTALRKVFSHMQMLLSLIKMGILHSEMADG